MEVMQWTPVEDVSRVEMVHHAARRGLVRLHSGQIAVLVSWPGNPNKTRGQSCRLETAGGGRFRVHIRLVESVCFEEP